MGVAAVGLAVVVTAVVFVARGGSVDGHLALALAGAMIVAGAVWLYRAGDDDAELDAKLAGVTDFDTAATVAIEHALADPAPDPTASIWRVERTTVIALTFVYLLAYFVMRVWRDYPWWFALAFIAAATVLLAARAIIMRALARRKRRA